jgi:hypothetical protein
MDNAELKAELAIADLIRDLAHAKEAGEKHLAKIVRFVRHREATGPAKDMMTQIGRDEKLCRLLVDLEDQSEIIGMTDFVRDLKMNPSRHRCSPKTAGSKR